MSRSARAFREHAWALLDDELHHARGRLRPLPVERRLAVEQVSARVAAAVVEDVLEQARAEPSLAQALVSIYGEGHAGPESRFMRLGLESRRGS